LGAVAEDQDVPVLQHRFLILFLWCI
jgi:hypothetical protein